MKNMKQAFEKEIRNKLSLKTNGKQSEETLLIKAFKYFDLDNSGECSRDEWLKALNKIGITGFNDKKLLELFEVYDQNRSDGIDYKEFVRAIYNDDEEGDSKPVQQTRPQKGGDQEHEHKRGDKGCALHDSKIMDKFREKILSRGGRGIIGLGRQFRIFDDDRSGKLDLPELTKAIRDFQVDLSPNEIKILFQLLDTDNEGEISYDEFLREIRGEMNGFRRKLVDKAFSKLDLDGSGHVDIEEIKSLYNTKKHPDVISGKKTEDEVFLEFMETFEAHAANKGIGTKGDRQITREEFQEYYENISASIDRDDYFELMMTNAWKLNAPASYEGKKAWKSENVNDRQIGMKSKYRAQYEGISVSQSAPWGTDGGKTNYTTSSNPKNVSMQIGTGGSKEMNKFRQALAARGIRGIMSMRRSFMIADDNNDKTLDLYEFQKLCKDYRIGLDDRESKAVFKEFDRDESNLIDYDEFVRGIAGEMNTFRKNIAKQAFKKMDKNNNGQIELDDIRGVYNAKFHPDVKAGKRTEDEVLAEFLDTFEYHFNLLNDNKSKDRSITMDEWIEYYNNISMSIDDDKYFELMMNNAWNLDGTRGGYKKGWKGEL